MNWSDINAIPGISSSNRNFFNNRLQVIPLSPNCEKELMKVQKTLEFQSDLSVWLAWPWTQFAFFCLGMGILTYLTT